MSVQGWLRKSSSGMLLRIVARQASDETLSLRLAVTGPALSPARLEDSWNVLDWENVPKWRFWIFDLRVWWSASPDCWPGPWGTWFLSKPHPAWLQISVGKTGRQLAKLQGLLLPFIHIYFQIKVGWSSDDWVDFLLDTFKEPWK